MRQNGSERLEKDKACLKLALGAFSEQNLTEIATGSLKRVKTTSQWVRDSLKLPNFPKTPTHLLRIEVEILFVDFHVNIDGLQTLQEVFFTPIQPIGSSLTLHTQIHRFVHHTAVAARVKYAIVAVAVLVVLAQRTFLILTVGGRRIVALQVCVVIVVADLRFQRKILDQVELFVMRLLYHCRAWKWRKIQTV